MNPISKGNPALTKVFVSIGECMVELAPQPAGLYAVGFAGDTFNTAFYARRCLSEEWSVAYFTAVGQDDVSDRMLAFMQGAGVATPDVLRLPERTVGLYMISLKGAERSFSYWRSQSAAKCLADDPTRLEQALSLAKVAYFSGITLAILDPAARQRLLAALSKARGRGVTIVFDPNLRPRLWASGQEMCAAIMAAAAVADIVLPSHEDEALHFGDSDPSATLQRYGAAGVPTVVVKDGAATILASHEGQTATYTPPPVSDIVDTTAAGDSFNAGFLAAFLSGESLVASLAAGASVAARVIAARGALVAI